MTLSRSGRTGDPRRKTKGGRRVEPIARDAGEGPQSADEGPEVSPEAEARGLRYALWATAAVLVGIALLTFIPGAPLRNPDTGKIIGDSPFMNSLIVIIMLVFFAAGFAFGRGAGTIRTKEEVIDSITKSWATLASLLFLFLLIAQFIAYFNFSNIAEVLAVKLGQRKELQALWDKWNAEQKDPLWKPLPAADKAKNKGKNKNKNKAKDKPPESGE